MPGGDLAQLRLIWQRAGRPGAAKLKDAAKRQGLNLTVKEVKEFVIAEAVAQVYQPAPRSEGKITSPELNARWQCDLIESKQKAPRRTMVTASFYKKPRSKTKSPRPSKESREQLGEDLLARGGLFPATLQQTPEQNSRGPFRSI